MGKTTLVLGGIRSGKSAFAEELVLARQNHTIYLATGQAVDAEMEQRIRRHQDRRPSEWLTLEQPLDLVAPLKQALERSDQPTSVLLDSLDGWMSNFLLENETRPFPKIEAQALSHVEDLAELAKNSVADFFLVSSEVGLSLVSPNSLGRQFQDLLGAVNQAAAALADDVYLVTAGIPQRIKGKDSSHL